MNIYQLTKYVTCILMYKHSRGMLPNNEAHTLTQLQYETTYSLQNTTLQNQYQTKHSHLCWSKTMAYCYYEESY